MWRNLHIYVCTSRYVVQPGLGKNVLSVCLFIHFDSLITQLRKMRRQQSFQSQVNKRLTGSLINWANQRLVFCLSSISGLEGNYADRGFGDKICTTSTRRKARPLTTKSTRGLSIFSGKVTQQRSCCQRRKENIFKPCSAEKDTKWRIDERWKRKREMNSHGTQITLLQRVRNLILLNFFFILTQFNSVVNKSKSSLCTSLKTVSQSN